MLSIKEYKSEKRAFYKNLRMSMKTDIKTLADREIFQKIIATPNFQKSELILTYISVNNEADTVSLIKYCFENGKRVAVPKCLDKNGNMEFFEIKSFDDVKSSYFGLLEPSEKCPKIDSFDNGLCIVPAFSYDKKGYRIGYGGGFYDRFLSKHNLFKIGICYDECIEENHLYDEFDINVDIVITEKQIISLEDENERKRT
ncbi:MAG: 5-formyltetrahydrofolate cyclo-ligase [Oscillospiraceae bacterium]|nr:5-formyltetrahydrofolate cyclo-ligase [Oscillospiraceae bacterium]